MITQGTIVEEDPKTQPRIEHIELKDVLPSLMPAEAKTAILNDWWKATEPTYSLNRLLLKANYV